MKYKQIPMNDMSMTYMEEADTQLEAMLNPRAEAAAKAHTTAPRKTIRRITRPMLTMLVLTFAAWLVTLLGALGVVDAVTAEAVKGGFLLAALIAAVVVTVRVMGGVGNAH